MGARYAMRSSNTRTWSRLRHLGAANLLDRPRHAIALRAPAVAARLGLSWEGLHNRGERLLQRAGQRGYLCDWRWTSNLRFCESNPGVGRRLLARALEDWPIDLPSAPRSPSTTPVVSFIVGHRGEERVPHLLATLRSIGAQVDAQVECVVVEQDDEPRLAGRLPEWVRHVVTPLPRPDLPYCRSWAFNVGARAAQGRYLVLHDNDLCVPARYAAEVVGVFSRGFEAARLQRFVFYLGPDHSQEVFASQRVVATRPPERIEQNCEGHTLAVRHDVYWEIGGHDEGFVGWGGEDNEILDRLRGRRLHDHAYLPLVHLSHPPQAGKTANHPNRAYFESRIRIRSAERIAQLRALSQGQMGGPSSRVSDDAHRWNGEHPPGAATSTFEGLE